MFDHTTPAPTALRIGAGLSGIALAGAYALAAPGIAGADTTLPTNCTTSGDTVTCSYTYTGAEQVFTVPDEVTSIDVTAVGGHGGAAGTGTTGGQGAEVSADLSVQPGTQLYVEVGGNGSDGGVAGGGTAGGWNGGGSGGWQGGGGGGASDIRAMSINDSGNTTASLTSRTLVAGAGGGASYEASGGDAGQIGGGNPATAGKPGTSDAGGSGGEDGSLGIGGNGADIMTSSGGGGAGYYGGGSTSPGNGGLGGGGGGSSLVPAGGGVPTLTSDAPSVTIVYSTSDGNGECAGSLCILFGSVTTSPGQN